MLIATIIQLMTSLLLTRTHNVTLGRAVAHEHTKSVSVCNYIHYYRNTIIKTLMRVDCVAL